MHLVDAAFECIHIICAGHYNHSKAYRPILCSRDESASHQLPRYIHHTRKGVSCYSSEKPVVGRHHIIYRHRDDIENVISHFW